MWREGETDNEYRTQEAGQDGMGVCSVDGEAGGSRAGMHSDTQTKKREKKAPKGGCSRSGITSRCCSQLDSSVLVFVFCSRSIASRNGDGNAKGLGGKISYKSLLNRFYGRLRWFLTYTKTVNVQIKRLKQMC